MNPFSAAKDGFTWLLEFLHDDVRLSFGWAIVAITILVRLLILPLFIKQYRSMRRMAAYAPQMKELQARYKGNRAKLNEEMMKFYRENDINPFSSCLPLLAQLPIFIVLYYTLTDFSREAEGRAGLDFMWIIPDVAEDLLDIGWGAAVLLVIYALSQLLSSELSMNPGTAANQKWLMRAIPLGAVLFVLTYAVPAGLVIYWLTTNLWTCGQQLVMKRKIGPNPYIEEAAAAATRTGAAPAPVPGAKRSSRTPPKSAAPAGEPGAKRRQPRTPAPGGDPAGDGPVDEPEVAHDPADANGTDPAPSPEPAPPAKGGGGQARKKPRGGPPAGQRRQPPKKKR